MNYAIYKYLETWITVVMDGLSNNVPSLVVQGIQALLPIILIPLAIITAIALAAIIFSILNYRTNKKILKKLEEKKD